MSISAFFRACGKGSFDYYCFKFALMWTFWTISSLAYSLFALTVTNVGMEKGLGPKDWTVGDTVAFISRNLKCDEEGHRCKWIITVPCDKCYCSDTHRLWGDLRVGPQMQWEYNQNRRTGERCVRVGRASLAEGGTFTKTWRDEKLGEITSVFCDRVKGDWRETTPGTQAGARGRRC